MTVAEHDVRTLDADRVEVVAVGVAVARAEDRVRERIEAGGDDLLAVVRTTLVRYDAPLPDIA